MSKELEVDIETRLMMAEIGLKVADTMINSLMRKIDRLIIENNRG